MGDKLKAKIFNIQRMSLHDGPGIRTTIFFSGCNLRCKWCHNPEAFMEVPTERETPRICAAAYTLKTDELVKIVSRDMLMYEVSSGGVTCSGGEPLLQAEVLAELLLKLKKMSIHTAVDTAGDVPFALFEKVIPFTDVFLFDLKHWDDRIHKKYTGVSNKRILANFNTLEQVAKIIVRIPVIDTIQNENCRPFVDILKDRKNVEFVELLPYHSLGEQKYRELGVKVPSYKSPTEKSLAQMKELLERNHIPVKVSGKFKK